MDSAAPSWISLLIQVPLVGVFIWYSLKLSEHSTEAQTVFMEALEKRDIAFTERNKALIEAMNVNNQAVCELIESLQRTLAEHDRLAREYIASQSTRRRA